MTDDFYDEFERECVAPFKSEIDAISGGAEAERLDREIEAYGRRVREELKEFEDPKPNDFSRPQPGKFLPPKEGFE